MLTTKTIYKKIFKPILFKQDAEKVHNRFTALGENISNNKISSSVMNKIFTYQNERLTQTIDDISFQNPVGLAAGFDYDGHLATTMEMCGFGFNTIGTVTAKPYKGNTGIRLGRLPKSQSLFVNKGFKSEGINKVLSRLDNKDLSENTIGFSIGSSNINEVDSIKKAIDDYVYSFELAKSKKYINYFELNISCPNARLSESFGVEKNFESLLKEIASLKIDKPIYVKMANELHLNQADILVKTGLKYKMNGFILSNLVKDRSNPKLVQSELAGFQDQKGNFSGKPTSLNSNRLINHLYKEYGKHATLIGCGGIFSANDAYERIKSGASLIQLITGMIFEGPQLAGEINAELIDFLDHDNFENISEAIGANHR